MTVKNNIASVANETGIAKEVLRKWESRYGFPSPQRDAAGNRVYLESDVERIKLIKNLLDHGMRAGQTVPLENEKLHALIAEKQSCRTLTMSFGASSELMTLLQSHNPIFLKDKLKDEIAAQGLMHFLDTVMPSMNAVIGDAWSKGLLSIRAEHLYTETVQTLLREEIAIIARANTHPRVLLTTPPGELHTLGLLMAEAALSMQGAYCLSLGAQLPPDEIVFAAQDYEMDIVGLSFSEAFPKRKLEAFLKDLRSKLPEEKQLWAGGNGVTGHTRKPHGVYLFRTIGEAIAKLRNFTGHREYGRT
jgi:MerR family transcriptional regulator, light-induced transcriptional regulator